MWALSGRSTIGAADHRTSGFVLAFRIPCFQSLDPDARMIGSIQFVMVRQIKLSGVVDWYLEVSDLGVGTREVRQAQHDGEYYSPQV